MHIEMRGGKTSKKGVDITKRSGKLFRAAWGVSILQVNADGLITGDWEDEKRYACTGYERGQDLSMRNLQS